MKMISQKKIEGFGDGPACFNYEMTERNGKVISFDLIYQFTKEDIEKRIDEVRITVMQQMRENMDNYVWKNIKSIDELDFVRMMVFISVEVREKTANRICL